MVKIFEMLSLENIKIIEENDKKGALKEVIQMLTESGSIKDPAELEKAIFKREEIMSTGIGLGIAIPHTRLKSIKKMTMAIGISKDGIDYDTLDSQKVHIIIMIAGSEGSHRQYLRVLAKIALLLKTNRYVKIL